MSSMTVKFSSALQHPSTPSNTEEFVEAVGRRRSQLVRVASRIAGCREDAEDIVQEALLKAFTNLDRFRGECCFDTWLHAIVVNTARGLLRSRQYRIVLPLECELQDHGKVVPREVIDPANNPEDLFSHNEARHLLHREIARLSQEYETVVRLRDLQDYSYREAADILGINLGKVRARLYQGRMILRDRLGPQITRACGSSTSPPHRHTYR